VHTADAEQIVPVPRVDVVDTVGAGDAFVAAFLTWWSNNARLREEVAQSSLLVEAATAAVQAAAAACTTRGANLPDDFVWGARGSSHLPAP
jgi:fructokinase